MARTELEKKAKRQGKKRKHEVAENPEHAASDDEVADKSLILAPQADQQEAAIDKPAKRRQKEAEVSVTKKRLRKNQAEELVATSGSDESLPQKTQKRKQVQDANETKKQKRSKTQECNSEDDDDADSQPTTAQLKEAARPENAYAVVTVRQKKKQKHQQRLEAQKSQSSNKDAKVNKEYLLKWKESRQDWKFNKLRQISIQQTAFDVEKLDEELWPTALEYLASSQGAARSKISQLAEEVILKLDKEGEKLEDEAERRKLIESTQYQRARDLLQSFD
ncbi:uncharacterized protein C7orf50 homolog [Drosophila mauritiana]|uniref:Uncharacterized protein C7orf50 homolog n=1 Tax=Drosophila mauritiana TaxID=7226 RepID=A0A6P8KC35_DROMA|nr:uncharacterized protein C7orf50 homolog [Drosophila mauritiana]